ncbi:MAG: hypothetical protein WDM91_13655 [Rhizomicrobium sp.]
MRKHPFRKAVEDGASRNDLVKLLSPDAEILAPMLTKPVAGAQQVLSIIGHAVRIAGPIEYLHECADTRQACTILVDGEDGLIGRRFTT